MTVRAGRLVEVREGGQIIGSLQQGRVSQWRQAFLSISDVLYRGVDYNFLVKGHE